MSISYILQRINSKSGALRELRRFESYQSTDCIQGSAKGPDAYKATVANGVDYRY